ncbi:hypothetical protein Syun_009183 [Stephania yunnanensis]|uniref:Uncharacterized protein n=1 Tax=Stephania yunnanensis TaxID=152371 RepID=A0AAP0KFW5_9MAGN
MSALATMMRHTGLESLGLLIYGVRVPDDFGVRVPDATEVKVIGEDHTVQLHARPIMLMSRPNN